MAIALSGSLILSGSITVSGSIISTGTISMSGSIASASYATNADLLDGLDSTVFTLTSSFAAQTASFTAFTSSINSFSASILAQTASLNSFSSSVLTFTGSAATRLGALEAATGSLYSYTSSLNNQTASFATTGSNTFIGTQTITGSVLQSGSFTSTGTLTAQTLVIQTITSSVVYSSGSNIFGNAIGNTQTFTGSVLVTGSLTIAGASSATSYSGATIYGSTVVCSPVGKFTSCIDVGGTGTFTGDLTLNPSGNSTITQNASTGNYNQILFKVNGTTQSSILALSSALYFSVNGSCTALTIASTGAATFSSTIRSDATNGLALGSVAGYRRLQYDLASTTFGFLTDTNSVANIDAGSATFNNNITIISPSSSADIGTTGQLKILSSTGVTSPASDVYLQAVVDSATPGDRGTAFVVQTGRTSGIAERFRISSTGAACFASTVCVGGELLVNGSTINVNCTNTTATDARINLYTRNSVNGDRASIYTYNLSATTAGCEITYLAFGYCCTNNQGYINMQTKSGGAWCNTMSIINGNVGIGAINPGAKLEISSPRNSTLLRLTAVSGENWDFKNCNAVGSTDVLSIGAVGATANLNLKDDGSVGIGASSPIARLHTCIGYGANNIQAVFGNSNGSINSQPYDTVIIQQDDVTTFKLVERNIGSVDQVLTITTGDSSSRISTTCANPLQFFVAGSPSACGYNGLSGINALTITCAGLIGMNQPAPSYRLEICSPSSTCLLGLMGASNVNIDMVGFGTSLTYPQARIQLQDDGYYGGMLSFFTKPNGAQANALTERMRICSNGDLTIKGNTHCIYTNAAATISFDINVTRGRFYQALTVDGTLTKGGGSFKIDHPLESKKDTYNLYHSFVESPKADLIYRGKVALTDGYATVNIDTAADMSEGTFEVLVKDVQCFTTNENGWNFVKGTISGNILTIESDNTNCNDEISWMVIGERNDKWFRESTMVDENGKTIVEKLKSEIT